jgi:hypothetical protein
MNIRKNIEGLLSKRKALVVDLEKLATAAGEKVFDADEAKAFDKVKAEIADLDAQVDRLEAAEKAIGERATPIAPAPTPTPGVEVKDAGEAFPGQAFVRMTLATIRAKGNLFAASAIAAEAYKDMPSIGEVLKAAATRGVTPLEVVKAAVPAGTTTAPAWAGSLVYASNVGFVDLLRNATIIDKLGLTPAPFNTSTPRQTGGTIAGWVGEQASIGVQALAFDRIALPYTKLAVISLLTRELVERSDPAAEMLVRNDLVNGIAEATDKTFIDPAITATNGVRPASITNGVTPIPSSGATVEEVVADLSAMVKALANANSRMISPAWVMTPAAKITLGELRSTTYEVKAYPEVNASNSLMGYPIVTSNSVPTAAGLTDIVFADWAEVLMARDAGVDLSVSEEASVMLDNAPPSPATPLVSLWQQGMVGVRSIQNVHWIKRRPSMVALLTGFAI